MWRRHLNIPNIIILVLFIAALIYGHFEQFKLQVREIELAFPNLPPAFDGYTILHLSDLHLAKFGLLEERLVELISAREVDACFITGDVTSKPRASDTFRRVCSSIPRRDAIYSVLGNSEHKPWLDTPMLVDALSFDGLHLLVNSSTKLRKGENELHLVGVDDAFTRHADVEKAFDRVDSNEFIIFLTHCPSLTPDGIDHGADLILSGHTHGGQVRLPKIGLIWTHMRANKKLNDGLYTPEDLRRLVRGHQDTNSALFVNRGVGTSRLHVRIHCPPEIAYITLRRS